MSRTRLLLCASILLSTLFGTSTCSKAAAAAAASNNGNRQFAVVGYIPEYRYGIIDWDAMCKHLTHAIFFSIEVTAEGELDAMDRFPNSEILARAHDAAKKYGTKLLICFGGNSRSGGFGTLVLSPEKRAHFIQNVMKLLDDNSLDGVDLNWEYPRSQAEWNGLFRLINEMKAAFKPTGRVLTMAVYPGQEKLLSKKAISNLDLVLDMVYDSSCSRGERPPCRHSTYEFAENVIKYKKVAKNLPSSKLALGVPFYARDMYNGSPETYNEIVKRTPSLTPSMDEVGTLYFNGQETIKRKTKLAYNKGLGGIMIWEMGQDTHPDNKLSLISAITEALKEVTPQKDEL